MRCVRWSVITSSCSSTKPGFSGEYPQVDAAFVAATYDHCTLVIFARILDVEVGMIQVQANSATLST